MTRFTPLSIVALLATPAFALEEGTYPLITENGGGELMVARDYISMLTTGPDQCEVGLSGQILRGADASWAVIVETGEEPCVLYGTRNAFSTVGASCALFIEGDCRLTGQIGSAPARTARPIQVIRPIIEGRFRRLDQAGRSALQTLLAAEGLYAGTVDGVYGSATEDAFVAYMQRMADQGEPVDGNSTTFIRELMSRLAEEGRGLITTAAPVTGEEADTGGAEAPVFLGAWSCGGYTFRFTPDRYQVINEYDRSVLSEGRLRPDGVVGRTAYLELVGYGNLTFDGVGTRDMIMHDPSNGETWDCAPG
jgi:hypothetical protein